MTRGLALLTALLLSTAAHADDAWSIHVQSTLVWQLQPEFHATFTGANSLKTDANGRETIDATLFAGRRLWDGGEVYANLEIDQGFGLSDTLGAAGFPSGEAYKVGANEPYIRLQRLFFRQTFDLGGDNVDVADAQNQVAGSHTANTLVLTGGKFSVGDVFDANSLAHDPRGDFLNWSLIDTGTFDYAADAWGYTYGATAEWTQDWWTLRAGLFDLSRVPNTTQLVRGLGQYEIDAEGEARYKLFGQDGTVKLLGFLNRGRMASYNDAVALGAATHATPDVSLVRKPSDRAGFALNAEQGLTDDLSAFMRAGLNDGSKEAFEFTEINRTVALGLSLKGADWGRPDDTVAIAGVDNGISHAASAYLRAGGLGILIGDGALPRYGDEAILETYYSAAATKWLTVSLDYQFIDHPGYDAVRGPASVFGLRLHAAY
ncbi:MAG TPA: carbohydrate porin [Rhizomicrobium sp.]|jgi:high affinity Mn2+ porin|nr:carbohydrate porin [Rhizomicrobium sp.]